MSREDKMFYSRIAFYLSGTVAFVFNIIGVV